MKRKLTGFALALMLAFALCAPSFAAAGMSTGTGAGTRCVVDTAGLLTFDERDDLENMAEDISGKYGCGVYAVTVIDYEAYGYGDVYDVTTQIYHDPANGFGAGDGRDGIILLLSMRERDYALFVYGEKAEYAFSDYGLRRLEEPFLEEFGDNNWYGGFRAYLNECDRFLAAAQEGNPVRASPVLPIVIAVAASCLIAIVVCLLIRASMNTVHKKRDAREYVAPGGLRLTRQTDQYTHTTRTSRKIESGGGSGGSHSHSGGGGHGRSGKF